MQEISLDDDENHQGTVEQSGQESTQQQQQQQQLQQQQQQQQQQQSQELAGEDDQGKNDSLVGASSGEAGEKQQVVTEQQSQKNILFQVKEYQQSYRIECSVLDPTKKESVKGFIQYTIRGEDVGGKFEDVRRFSEFDALRSSLVLRWPGCYVPPLPEKKMVGNTDTKFIEERRLQLDWFMKQLASYDYLWYSEETQIFLHHQGLDLEKKLGQLGEQDYQTLIEKYEKAFSHLAQKEINNEVIIKINSFFMYLKRTKAILENYKQIAKNLIQQQKLYSDQQQIFHETILPEYERQVLREYLRNPVIDSEKFVVLQENFERKELQEKLKRTLQKSDYQIFYESLRTHEREVESLIEAITIRNNYEAQKLKCIKKKEDLNVVLTSIISGKSSLKDKISTKSKSEQMTIIQEQIETEKRNIENISHICDIMAVVLSYVEIEKFKREKQVQYYSLIKSIARSEIELNSQIEAYWRSILTQSPLSN